jgi:hypothetical protein
MFQEVVTSDEAVWYGFRDGTWRTGQGKNQAQSYPENDLFQGI